MDGFKLMGEQDYIHTEEIQAGNPEHQDSLFNFCANGRTNMVLLIACLYSCQLQRCAFSVWRNRTEQALRSAQERDSEELGAAMASETQQCAASIFSSEVPLDTHHSLLSQSWEVWSLEHSWVLSRLTPFMWHPNEDCSLLLHSSLAESSLLTALLLANRNKLPSSSEVFTKPRTAQRAGVQNTLQCFRVVI